MKTQRLERLIRDGSQYGSVSCLQFSPDGSQVGEFYLATILQLVVGYSKGLVRFINVKSGKVTNDIVDAVQPSHGVLQLTFYKRHTSETFISTELFSSSLLLVVDSGGSVFEVQKRRGLTGRRHFEVSF